MTDAGGSWTPANRNPAAADNPAGPAEGVQQPPSIGYRTPYRLRYETRHPCNVRKGFGLVFGRVWPTGFSGFVGCMAVHTYPSPWRCVDSCKARASGRLGQSLSAYVVRLGRPPPTPEFKNSRQLTNSGTAFTPDHTFALSTRCQTLDRSRLSHPDDEPHHGFRQGAVHASAN